MFSFSDIFASSTWLNAEIIITMKHPLDIIKLDQLKHFTVPNFIEIALSIHSGINDIINFSHL